MAAPESILAADERHPGSGTPRRRLSEPPVPSENVTGPSASWGSIPSLGPKGGVRNMARRTLGISLLLLTVFLWTASNFLASNGGYTRVKNQAIQEWRMRYKGIERLKTQEEEEAVTVGERLLADDEASFEVVDPPETSDKLSFLETARYSLEFCMIWFLGNYFASACLEYTSVASVTILTSTSSVWTLIFCAVMRIEPFSVRKLIGVMASLAGIILISTVDLSGKDNDDNRGNFPHKSQQQIAIGDAMAIFSAVVYGLYVVVMKVRIGNEDRVNMPLFFGLVGIFNIFILWPLFFILHFTGIEPVRLVFNYDICSSRVANREQFELPPSGKVWAIIILNSLSSFVSDISWAYAMLLTTPLVVTVGLSLTIPLSLIGEMIQYAQYSSFIYWIGAAIVLVSFAFINHESHDEDEGAKAGPERLNRAAEP
ncbi:hypothetical protein Daesc_004659 [Daldinia eschscholtzii]|uniref:EamA domain-containing protein n=1 Tax=Daldinia eschscholtzii TaxID=292717 RepID=A0AAX6MR92_9PEZI